MGDFLNPYNLLGGFLFSLVGFGAFRYGKSQGKGSAMLIGGALMIYPYFTANPAATWLIGAALTGALFLFRD